MKLLLSSDNKNVPDCPQQSSHTKHHAHAPMEKNITIVKVDNGSRYKCIFEIEYRHRLTLPCR